MTRIVRHVLLAALIAASYLLAGPPPSQAAFPGDNGKILFDGAAPDGDGEIYKMRADGSGVVNLTNDPALDGGGAWSPDGSRIAFISDRDSSGQLNRQIARLFALEYPGGVHAECAITLGNIRPIAHEPASRGELTSKE